MAPDPTPGGMEPGAPKPDKISGWFGFFDFLGSLVDRFGWPGLLLIAGFWSVNKWATDEQKREMIDSYVLGKNVQSIYPYLILGAVFVLVVLAQSYFYRRRLETCRAEVERLAAWKSAHQERNLGGGLEHSDPTL